MNTRHPPPATRHPPPSRWRWAAALVCTILGCNDAGKPTTTAQPVFAGVKVRLGVVGDPMLAREVGRIKGEWQARTGAELEIVEMPVTADLSQPLAADVLFYPSYWLGPLAERDLLLPLPASWRASEELAWNDILELVRTREVAWGEDNILAVPLGSPVLVAFYRADWLRDAKLEPPRTWADYQRIAAHFANPAPPASDPGAAPRYGSIEPLGPGWAGITMLARAASYARHKDIFSDLFDADTMQPLIDSPPFVTALEELAAAYRTGPPEQLEYDPAAVQAAFFEGHSALAIGWPSAAFTESPAASALPLTEKKAAKPKLAAELEIGFVQLPGSARSFHRSEAAWQDRDKVQNVPLLSVSGRLGSVLRASPQQAAALALLGSISSREWGDPIGQSLADSTFCRRAQSARPAAWLPASVGPRAADDYARAVVNSLESEQWMFCLRIPGRDRYLQALDAAVQQTLGGKSSAADALGQAAARWREITTELGSDQQLRAYRRSLGTLP